MSTVAWWTRRSAISRRACGASFAPDNPAWRDAFVRLQERGRVVFSATIEGAVSAKHGTTIDTLLTVIDRFPAIDPTGFPASPGIAPDAATLLGWVTDHVPARRPLAASVTVRPVARLALPRTVRAYATRPSSAPASTPERRSNLPVRRWTGGRWRAAKSPRHFMKNTDCRRSVFPALRPIRPSWFSRRRCPPSPAQAELPPAPAHRKIP